MTCLESLTEKDWERYQSLQQRLDQLTPDEKRKRQRHLPKAWVRCASDSGLSYSEMILSVIKEGELLSRRDIADRMEPRYGRTSLFKLGNELCNLTERRELIASRKGPDHQFHNHLFYQLPSPETPLFEGQEVIWLEGSLSEQSAIVVGFKPHPHRRHEVFPVIRLRNNVQQFVDSAQLTVIPQLQLDIEAFLVRYLRSHESAKKGELQQQVLTQFGDRVLVNDALRRLVSLGCVQRSRRSNEYSYSIVEET